MTTIHYTTQEQLRAAFWQSTSYARVPGKTQNDYPADVRMEWVQFVDDLERSGEISEALADRATL